MFNFIQLFKKFKLPFLSTLDICFDLGTSNTRIGIREKGKVLNEPTYVGVNTSSKEYIFFGNEAKTIVGKTPESVKIIRPVINGVISDFDAQVALLHSFIQKSVDVYFHNFTLLRPQLRALVAVPYRATEIEQKAVDEALLKLGFSSVYLIEKPVAAALGVGINIFYHHPHLLIDMGGGLIELSIVSGGGIVAEKFSTSSTFLVPFVFSFINAILIYIFLPESNKILQKHIKIAFLNLKVTREVFKPKNISWLCKRAEKIVPKLLPGDLKTNPVLLKNSACLLVTPTP